MSQTTTCNHPSLQINDDGICCDCGIQAAPPYCAHPPAELYSWMADNGYGERTVPVVCCRRCRHILTGGA